VPVLRGIVRALRPYVDRVPWLAATYRDVRERIPARFYRVVDTPLGFRFAGPALTARGGFEPNETKFITGELGTTDVFVDVGANVGYFTCLARSHGVHTVAVEPLAGNLKLLYTNLRANAWPDVEVFPVALAERPGLLELYGTSTGASLLPGWAGISRGSVRLVPVSTLDNLLSTRFAGQRMLVKIDVEGVEHQVLRGAEQTLARQPSPRWLVEVCLTENQPGINPHFREVFDAFWKHGYRAESVEERREITRADVDEWITTGRRTFGSYNVLFMRDAS
jgi:FkbM family methyltransferase